MLLVLKYVTNLGSFTYKRQPKNKEIWLLAHVKKKSTLWSKLPKKSECDRTYPSPPMGWLYLEKLQEQMFNFNPIQDWPFQGCSRMGGGKKTLCKIYQTYPIMMKFGTVTAYIKNIQKIYKSRDTPLEFCFFHRKSAIFAISRNTDIHSIKTHNL